MNSVSHNFYHFKGVTPYQKYEGCDDTVNMLNGETKTIFLNVDDQDPVVECGFHDIHQGNIGAHVEGNVLYYYAEMKDDNELEVSNFFYKASVSRSLSFLFDLI